jgi:hypothetical protein
VWKRSLPAAKCYDRFWAWCHRQIGCATLLCWWHF